MKTNWLRHLVPNLGTVLTVAFLLFVYRAWAAPALPAPAPGVAAPATLTATTVQPEGATVNAVTPGVISYQGTLTDASGKPLNGTINMTFRLYAAPTGGTAVWTEAHTGANAVPVSNGLFNVLLGSLTPIPSEVWSNATLYLGVQVGSDAEMAPREVVGAAPSAMRVLNGNVILDVQYYRTWLFTQQQIQSGIVELTDPNYHPLTISTTEPAILDITLTASACGDRGVVLVYVDEVDVGGPMTSMPCAVSYKTTSLTYRIMQPVNAGNHTISVKLQSIDGGTVGVHGVFALTVLALGQ